MMSDVKLHAQKLPHAYALPAEREDCWMMKGDLRGCVLEITSFGWFLIVPEFLAIQLPRYTPPQTLMGCPHTGCWAGHSGEDGTLP